MPDLPKGRDPEKASEMAAAEGLFDDAPTTAPEQPQPVPTAAPGEEVEGFELADDGPAPAIPRPEVPAWELEEASEATSTPSARLRAPRRGVTASPVDQVWTRGAEWGPELVILGLWTLLIMFLLYVTVGGAYYSMALAVLAMGAFGGLVLAYPLFITMERPVRMTPERALKDFYDAVSHHRPHYRRMWLLLSNAGRTSSKFASYEGFRKYWVDALKQLKSGQTSGTTPLAFKVTEFQDKKDEDKTVADATWTLSVYVRGKRGQGPIATLPMESTFSKGADNMWYLDKGTLEERPERLRGRRGGDASS